MEWVTPEWIVSFSSLLVAVVALVFSIWQGVVSRKHNRLSVMPYLDVYIPIQSDKTGLFLRNTGSGLMLISSIEIEDAAGKKFDFKQSEICTFFEELKSLPYVANILPNGTSIPAGKEICLFRLSSPTSKENRKLIEEMFRNKTLTVIFESIYKEKSLERTLLLPD